MNESTVKLGDSVRDKITGFEGVAVARVVHLYGCVRVHVQPRELKEGKPAESEWLDEEGLEVLQKGVVHSHNATIDRGPAGPGGDPPDRENPA